MDLWQKKLLAFLHDPPHKPLDIRGHEEAPATFLRQAGFLDENAIQEFTTRCDHTAAAADRFPFPDYRASELKSDFSGSGATPFRHPLGGSDFVFDNPIPTPAFAEDILQTAQKGIDARSLPEQDRSRANFFLHWRRWPIEAAKKDLRTWFLPADTRLPDHSVWIHNSVTSALQACVTENGELQPAFLIFQLGPVQEFIGQARSARDLWSGSYLLSWLTARALKAVTDKVGPDCVIFPALRGQPLFDLLHRDELYGLIRFPDGQGGNATLWDRMKQHEKEMLTPSLPNRFFAVVPANSAEELAGTAEQAVWTELKTIAAACWKWFAERKHPLGDDCRERYDRQVELFPRIAWQVCPWRGTVDEALKEFEALCPPDEKGNSPAKRLREIHQLAVNDIPVGHRDERYFTDKTTRKHLNNRGFCWAYFYALTEWLLAMRRNTRDFESWNTDEHQEGARKDSLSGKEEVVGAEAWWKELADNPALQPLFRSQDRLGAVNIVKKVWHRAYLEQAWGLDVGKAVSFKSVPDVAAAAWDGVNNQATEGKPPPSYYAVLALDGDEMGKWVSGEKTPAFQGQLSKGAQDYLGAHGLTETMRRPLSPSYHLQFSEALSNFTLYLVRPVVERFGGQLIYAGGDDVLAIVPAAKALDCAEALRAAFRGDPAILDQRVPGLFKVYGTNGGFVRLADPKAEQPTWPLIVPGPNADVSVGIAIGHIHAPLQNLVRAAQSAEKRAKDAKQYNRAAFAVSLYKRSGEILEWGAKWDSGALDLYRRFNDLSGGESPRLSGRFGYALFGMLQAYRVPEAEPPAAKPALENVENFPWREVVLRELEHVLKRQGVRMSKDERAEFICLCENYCDRLEKDKRPLADDFPMLFQAANFIRRGEH